jgi:hypothetical protein
MRYQKDVRPIRVSAYPPLLTEIFDLLRNAGAAHYALFGGAVRDADHAARRGRCQASIKDYDLRVWIDDSQSRDFIDRLSRLSGEPVEEEPSAGTGRIRYCLNFLGAPLDISLRTPPANSNGKPIAAEAVAIDRAGDADIGLCSVAVDPRGQAWGTREYELDQQNDTLTVYPIADAERRAAYARRMQDKFPSNRLIWLEDSPSAAPRYSVPAAP